MKWLVALSLAMVAAGGLYVLLSEGGPKPETPKQLQSRLLRDDSLAPPSKDAGPDTQKAYEEALQAISRGEDPLKKEVDPAKAQARLEARKAASEQHRREGKERAEKARAKAQEHREQMLRAREARDRERALKGIPPPTPLVPPLQLPPPVQGVEPPAKK
jgi:hypothetical protein